MTRTVALRASALFALLALVLAALGAGSQGTSSGAIIFVGLVPALLTAVFASLTPASAPVPVRIRSRRR